MCGRALHRCVLTYWDLSKNPLHISYLAPPTVLYISLDSLSLGVCECVRVCVCVCVCAGTQVTWRTSGGQKTTSGTGFFLWPCLRQGSVVGLWWEHQTSQTASSWAVSCLCTLSLVGVTQLQVLHLTLHRFWGLKFKSHTYTASTSPAKPSLQLYPWYFRKK